MCLVECLKRLWTYDTFRVMIFAGGIIGCFFVYGIMQEKVMRGCFGGDVIDGKCEGERFTYEMCLVLIYCSWYAAFSKSKFDFLRAFLLQISNLITWRRFYTFCKKTRNFLCLKYFIAIFFTF